MPAFTTALLVGGALAGGVIGGSKLAERKMKKAQSTTPTPAETSGTPMVPAPPPSANQQASAATAASGVAASKVRKRASPGAFASLARSTASGIAQPGGSPKSLIGS